MKFKKGNVITPKEYCSGFENATIVDIFEQDGKKYYKARILNGIATIPQGAEVNYDLVKNK